MRRDGGICAVYGRRTLQELSWDEPTKSLVLSSFFWGYPLCQMFMGPLAQSYGAKYFLAGSMGICAVLTTITPLTAVYGGAAAMCANQMLQGMLQVSDANGMRLN